MDNESVIHDEVDAYEGGAEVVLICWEHQHVPVLDATTIPSAWPSERFDVIWTFTVHPTTGRYVFGQVPQQLLLGDDTDTVISDDETGRTS
jgi:hypothetical protein